MQVDEADDVALRGLGSLSDAGRTIHTGYGPSLVRVSCPPFTNSSSASWVIVDRDHGKGSSTRVGGAMEDKGREQGWWWKPQKRKQIRRGGTCDWEEETPQESPRAVAVNTADTPHC
jgi:hypothetical protein